jgi:hypothetical protein
VAVTLDSVALILIDDVLSSLAWRSASFIEGPSFGRMAFSGAIRDSEFKIPEFGYGLDSGCWTYCGLPQLAVGHTF